MKALFDHCTIGGVELDNRIVVSPMCQYAATDGLPSAWHGQHLRSLALSGAALLMLESTAVAAEGRISHACLGLYEPAHGTALRGLVSDIHQYSDVALGVQLAHSGRKGSMRLPWAGDGPLGIDEGGWHPIAPSAVPFVDSGAVPREALEPDLRRIRSDYVDAARRAVDAGFDVIEIHAAHGYLLHQFLSPLTNRRTDAYGSSATARRRFPLEVFAAVRDVVPRELALGVRISGSDWHQDGNGPAEAGLFAAALQDVGADYLCVSSGGIVPGVAITTGPGYQVPMAREVRAAVSIPVMTVGMISDPMIADRLIRDDSADLIAMARAFISDPRWGIRAAAALGQPLDLPHQYRPGEHLYATSARSVISS